ncbi:unnamed protein product, partial [Staurois parvus]
ETIQFSPLSAPTHCFVWLCIAEPYKAVCFTVESTHKPPHNGKTHTQQILCSPQRLTPSYPVPLVQCHCFLLTLITVYVSLGMSVTPS